MKILALDFSTLRRSAALLDGERVLNSITHEPRRAGSPFPLITEVLGNTSRDEIDAIAIGLGPGSYTGIRSSLAIAQGWNLAKKIPAAGISSADAIAFETSQKGIQGELEVVIDAQRGEIYSAIYNLNGPGEFTLIRPLKIISKPETANVIGPGHGPAGSAIGILAARGKKFDAPELLEAIYLREPSFVKAPAARHS